MTRVKGFRASITSIAHICGANNWRMVMGAGGVLVPLELVLVGNSKARDSWLSIFDVPGSLVSDSLNPVRKTPITFHTIPPSEQLL